MVSAAVYCLCVDPYTIPFLSVFSLSLSDDSTTASENVSWIRVIKYAEYFSQRRAGDVSALGVFDYFVNGDHRTIDLLGHLEPSQ